VLFEGFAGFEMGEPIENYRDERVRVQEKRKGAAVREKVLCASPWQT
jgi:hypothetical protein